MAAMAELLRYASGNWQLWALGRHSRSPACKPEVLQGADRTAGQVGGSAIEL